MSRATSAKNSSPVTHLLEVRHHPALVHRITVKPARQLVIYPSASHVLESGGDEVPQIVVTSARRVPHPIAFFAIGWGFGAVDRVPHFSRVFLREKACPELVEGWGF
jgi:hypothetical protein